MMERQKLELALAQYKEWQKTIKGAEKIASFDEIKKAYRYEASIHNIAIECIEKQIPMKPLFQWNGNETEILCPCCKKYPFDDSEYEWARQYCGNCGQAIDWSEEDGKEEKA